MREKLFPHYELSYIICMSYEELEPENVFLNLIGYLTANLCLFSLDVTWYTVGI